ncbi:MAG TPA: hypothetical protein VFZ16_19590 [Hyphomicrobiaceae bacterium]|nr:hypothetical protein [Hyphomicrobiaceae bacterium]
MTTHRIFASALLAASGMLLLAQGAEARIVCDGNFQIVNGLAVSTPYCRDLTLARVARSRGFHVTDRAIRYNEGTRAQVCRAIGFDNRVQEVCAPYRSDNGANGRQWF